MAEGCVWGTGEVIEGEAFDSLGASCSIGILRNVYENRSVK